MFRIPKEALFSPEKAQGYKKPIVIAIPFSMSRFDGGPSWQYKVVLRKTADILYYFPEFEAMTCGAYQISPQEPTEWKAGKDFLTGPEFQIQPERVVEEKLSMTTREQATIGLALCQMNHIDLVILVVQEHQAWRAWKAFRKANPAIPCLVVPVPSHPIWRDNDKPQLRSELIFKAYEIGAILYFFGNGWI